MIAAKKKILIVDKKAKVFNTMMAQTLFALQKDHKNIKIPRRFLPDEDTYDSD